MNKGDLQRQVTVRLFQTSNAMQSFMDKLLKKDNLTAKQLFMMIIIGTFDIDPKLSDIADRFETSHQNVKQVILKLERSGYLELYKDPQDSRITRTRFTEQARQFWSNRDEADSETMDAMYQRLNEDNLSQLLNGLLLVLEQIKTMEGML